SRVSLFLVFGFVSRMCSTNSFTVLNSLFVVICCFPFLYSKYIIHQIITNVKSKNKKEQKFYYLLFHDVLSCYNRLRINKHPCHTFIVIPLTINYLLTILFVRVYNSDNVSSEDNWVVICVIEFILFNLNIECLTCR